MTHLHLDFIRTLQVDDIKEIKFNNELTDEQWLEFRKWLIGHMKMGPMSVTFTKKDGTERVMNCTLQAEHLPPQEIKESTTTTTRKENTDSIRVFDLDKKEWRSFIVKSVKKVQFEL